MHELLPQVGGSGVPPHCSSRPPQAVEELGPVGVLVNSAGATFPAAFLDTPTLKFQVGGPQIDRGRCLAAPTCVPLL